jgi:hypothetical protein
LVGWAELSPARLVGVACQPVAGRVSQAHAARELLTTISYAVRLYRKSHVRVELAYSMSAPETTTVGLPKTSPPNACESSSQKSAAFGIATSMAAR